MEKYIKYPFVPKSVSYLKEGQFWDIPLSNGQYACGRVLQFKVAGRKKDSRSILAGLLDWTGDNLPTFESIEGAKLLEQGDAHIRTIAFNGGAIQGYRPLELDNISPILELDQMPGKNCWLVKGYERLRLATIDEQKSLYLQSAWGLAVIKIAAEAYFVKKNSPKRRLPWEEMMELISYIQIQES